MLQEAGQDVLSHLVLLQQLRLFGKVSAAPGSSPLRSHTLCSGSIDPLASKYIRKVGRLRNDWAAKLTNIGNMQTVSADAPAV